MTVEVFDNLLQFTALLICLGLALWTLYRSRDKRWVPITLFYACCWLAQCFWLLFLALMKHTPHYSYAAELGWYAAYLCLCMGLVPLLPEKRERRGLLPWLGPLFSAAAALFFILLGDSIVSNLICGVVMGGLGWLSLAALRNPGRGRVYAWACLFLYCLEYALWISSCFVSSDTLASPYTWLDFLLTASLISLLPCYRRVVEP